RAGNLRHGLEVLLDLLEGDRAGVAGDVVGSRQHDHRARAEIDDVLAEAQEELRGRLAVDAAIDVGLSGKVTLEGPGFGDRIAEEDDAAFTGGGRRQLRVGRAVAAKLREV